jgi:rubredoxin
MQPQQPTNQEMSCPVCGAEPAHRVWSQWISYGAIKSKKHKMSGSQTTPLVCTVCGYVQLFVNPEDFRD